MGKIGPQFSHLLTVRAEGANPPLLPLTVSLTVKIPFFDDRPYCMGPFYRNPMASICPLS